MPRRLVLVNESFSSHAVDDRDGVPVRALRRFQVAGANCLDDLLDVRPQARTHAGIM